VLYFKWYLRIFCLGSVSLKYITSYFTLGFVRAGSLVVGDSAIGGDVGVGSQPLPVELDGVDAGTGSE